MRSTCYCSNMHMVLMHDCIASNARHQHKFADRSAACPSSQYQNAGQAVIEAGFVEMKAPQGKEVYGFREVKGMASLLGHRLLEKAVLRKQDFDKRCYFLPVMVFTVRFC